MTLEDLTEQSLLYTVRNSTTGAVLVKFTCSHVRTRLYHTVVNTEVQHVFKATVDEPWRDHATHAGYPSCSHSVSRMGNHNCV